MAATTVGAIIGGGLGLAAGLLGGSSAAVGQDLLKTGRVAMADVFVGGAIGSLTVGAVGAGLGWTYGAIHEGWNGNALFDGTK